MATKFQVKLSGEWKDYSDADNKTLKRAYAAGSPTATLEWKGHTYVCDLKKMVQINQESGKEHRIRPPFAPKAPAKPRGKKPVGPSAVVNVPPGAPGTTIQVPHPHVKGAFIAVDVPASAKVGQAMLVPVPEDADVSQIPPSKGKHSVKPAQDDAPTEGRPAEALSQESPSTRKLLSEHKASSGSWSTGGKIGAGIGIGGVAVAGVLLGHHVAGGSDDADDAVVEGGVDTLEADDDIVAEAGELVDDAGEDVTDSVLDLF